MKYEDRHITASISAGVMDLLLRWITGWEVLGMLGISLITYGLILSYLKNRKVRRKKHG